METLKISEDASILQSYVILSSDQIMKISQLFDVYDRDGISAAVKTIVNEYIKEHDREDVKKLQASNAWEDFTNKFNDGMFDKKA